ncbi:hypothetical protein PTSG_06817 [Salpingoeca rosetta]|uniref:Uncharacterized protein n=1 Tax=Salpingoeca rosetta (strain ATCC 50818 / BSB-021) TaxID=946362 RepID=F2UEW4_SALR5|nr:uncharacterized protein PTSG_06817 [Salpingoeca rosetta]EGD75164.1 hypothetical protein PTSG_06817 [Salpingoeca rosetta]|eukprot:XP_004992217.1 hypothetical protein PTSG_06817 [Salpingoeca rosetta]
MQEALDRLRDGLHDDRENAVKAVAETLTDRGAASLVLAAAAKPTNLRQAVADVVVLLTENSTADATSLLDAIDLVLLDQSEDVAVIAVKMMNNLVKKDHASSCIAVTNWLVSLLNSLPMGGVLKKVLRVMTKGEMSRDLFSVLRLDDECNTHRAANRNDAGRDLDGADSNEAADRSKPPHRDRFYDLRTKLVQSVMDQSLPLVERVELLPWCFVLGPASPKDIALPTMMFHHVSFADDPSWSALSQQEAQDLIEHCMRTLALLPPYCTNIGVLAVWLEIAQAVAPPPTPHMMFVIDSLAALHVKEEGDALAVFDALSNHLIEYCICTDEDLQVAINEGETGLSGQPHDFRSRMQQLVQTMPADKDAVFPVAAPPPHTPISRRVMTASLIHRICMVNRGVHANIETQALNAFDQFAESGDTKRQEAALFVITSAMRQGVGMAAADFNPRDILDHIDFDTADIAMRSSACRFIYRYLDTNLRCTDQPMFDLLLWMCLDDYMHISNMATKFVEFLILRNHPLAMPHAGAIIHLLRILFCCPQFTQNHIFLMESIAAIATVCPDMIPATVVETLIRRYYKAHAEDIGLRTMILDVVSALAILVYPEEPGPELCELYRNNREWCIEAFEAVLEDPTNKCQCELASACLNLYGPCVEDIGSPLPPACKDGVETAITWMHRNGQHLIDVASTCDSSLFLTIFSVLGDYVLRCDHTNTLDNACAFAVQYIIKGAAVRDDPGFANALWCIFNGMRRGNPVGQHLPEIFRCCRHVLRTREQYRAEAAGNALLVATLSAPEDFALFNSTFADTVDEMCEVVPMLEPIELDALAVFLDTATEMDSTIRTRLQGVIPPE